MSEPPSGYTDAYNGLVAFRKKIFAEIVSGRVKAQLDANHETLQKYGELVDSISVVPYMFGNIRQKALALKLNGLSVGEGGIEQAKANFALTKGNYPIESPMNVPSRLLPQVDVFVYTPPTDIELVEKTNEQMWGNLFVLQADLNKFIEQADVSNVFFDFYKLLPIGRRKIDVNLSQPQTGFDIWNKLSGEATILVRELTKVGESTRNAYIMYVFVDANFYSTENQCGVVPLVIIVPSELAGYPESVFITGGKRSLTSEAGVFVGWVTDGQFTGWTKTHIGYELTLGDVLWSNPMKLEIQVNDLLMGTTDPPPEIYSKTSVDEVLVTALPNGGYAVKNWELNGVQYPASDDFLVKCFYDRLLLCIFAQSNTVTIRPNANGDKIELYAFGDSPNYKCVDEEISDGDTTFVANPYPNTLKIDLYSLPDPSLPPDAIIDYVTVWVRIRNSDPFKSINGGTAIKTNGQEFYNMFENVPHYWIAYSKKYETNPYTGDAWTIPEVQAVQAGCRLERKKEWDYSWHCLCTQVWVEVRYHTE